MTVSTDSELASLNEHTVLTAVSPLISVTAFDL